jgi:hypothetical protein
MPWYNTIMVPLFKSLGTYSMGGKHDRAENFSYFFVILENCFEQIELSVK